MSRREQGAGAPAAPNERDCVGASSEGHLATIPIAPRHLANIPITPRGLNRRDAAALTGLSPTAFDRKRKEGAYPGPTLPGREDSTGSCWKKRWIAQVVWQIVRSR